MLGLRLTASLCRFLAEALCTAPGYPGLKPEVFVGFSPKEWCDGTTNKRQSEKPLTPPSKPTPKSFPPGLVLARR